MNSNDNEQESSKATETTGRHNNRTGSIRVNAVWYGLAAAIALLAPLLVFLSSNGYPLFATETVAIYTFAVAFGLLVWAAALPFWRLPALMALTTVVAFAIASLVQPGTIWTGIAVTGCAAAGVLLLRDNAAKLVSIAAGAHIATTLGLGLVYPHQGTEHHESNDTAGIATAASPPPPLVHLILDELSGPHGFPADIPGGSELSQTLSGQLRDSGFDVHSHAFAQYALTNHSIPNEFNFSAKSDLKDFLQPGETHNVLTRNKYFTHLLELGYTLDVYQSNYLDYCQTPGVVVRNCTTYASNSINTIANLDIHTWQKARFILSSFLDSSKIYGYAELVYRRINQRLGNPLPHWRKDNSRTGPLAVSATTTTLRAALERLAPGEAHVAHLLMPHYPYVYDAGCNVKPTVNSWLNRRPFTSYEPLEEQNTAAARKLRYQQYFEQVSCVQTQLSDLLAAIQLSGQWQDAIVIIQGDHGARIARHEAFVENSEKLTPEDFRDTYSAFFAVKGPSSDGRLIAKPQPLQTLLAAEWSLPPPQIVNEQVFLQMYGPEELVATPLRGFDK